MSKFVFTTTLFLFFFCYATAQDESVKIGQKYFFKTTIESPKQSGVAFVKIKINRDGKEKIANVAPPIKKWHAIEVSNIKDGTVYFRYLKFKDTISVPYQEYNKDKDSTHLFTLPQNDFERITSPYLRYWRAITIGTYSVPIRIRPHKENFEFDANISLGASLMVTRGFSHRRAFPTLSFAGGLSITKVNLNKSNSDVGVQGTAFADLTTLSPTALTPTLGLFMQFNEKASLGITVGWDHLSSADSKANWKHNKQWWFGMGFNIGISDYKPKAASTEKEQSKEDE